MSNAIAILEPQSSNNVAITIASCYTVSVHTIVLAPVAHISPDSPDSHYTQREVLDSKPPPAVFINMMGHTLAWNSSHLMEAAKKVFLETT